MTTRRDDWDVLAASWRTMPTTPRPPHQLETLRATARRRGHGLLVLVVVEVCLTVAVLAFVVELLLRERSRMSWVAAACAVVMTIVVWSFTTWNRRGIWRPLSESTSEYLRLSRQRIVAGRRTLRFVRVSTVLYVAAYGPWFLYRASRLTLSDGEVFRWVAAAAYGAGLVLWSAWYQRRLSDDLAQIQAMETSLDLRHAA